MGGGRTQVSVIMWRVGMIRTSIRNLGVFLIYCFESCGLRTDSLGGTGPSSTNDHWSPGFQVHNVHDCKVGSKEKGSAYLALSCFLSLNCSLLNSFILPLRNHVKNYDLYSRSGGLQ